MQLARTRIQLIVLATAKIHILKQFTTLIIRFPLVKLLCLLLQRYTFWSNSQPPFSISLPFLIVLATAKIHILKQFTTFGEVCQTPTRLCLLLQRYTFWSNSQRLRDILAVGYYCACYCKDTHFEAIHNNQPPLFCILKIMLATAKIHILKQFTTEKTVFHIKRILCLLLQRYTFWSNSQRIQFWFKFYNNCACYCKDTHFEAIHNKAVHT